MHSFSTQEAEEALQRGDGAGLARGRRPPLRLGGEEATQVGRAHLRPLTDPARLQETQAGADIALVGGAGQLRQAPLDPAKDEEIGNVAVHRDLPGHADGPWSRK